MNPIAAGALSGIATGAAQNAPAIKQALGIGQPPSTAAPANQGQTNAQLNPSQYDTDATNPNSATDIGDIAAGGSQHPMANPNHPVWGIMGQAAGVPTGNSTMPQPGAPAASPYGQYAGVQGMSKGGAVPGAPPVSQRPPTGPLPANFGSAKGYQGGGPIVGNNYGALTKRPAFTKGPAIPVDGRGVHFAEMKANGVTGMAAGGPVNPSGGANTSMGQGITPASTEGQVLTMDNGGVVNAGEAPSSQAFMPATPLAAPPVTGRAAGLSMGIQSGVALGHNIREMYEQHQQREQMANYENQIRQSTDAASGYTPPEGGVQGAIDKVFHLFHSKSLDNNNEPNTAPAPGMSAAPPGVYPQSTSGVPSANPPGQAYGQYGAPPAGGVPAGAQGAPAAGAAPAAGQNPGAAPGASPAPAGAGAPAKTPVQQAATAAGQSALQSTGGDTGAAAATATAVAATAANPNTQAGVSQKTPQQSGKQALSLKPVDYAQLEDAKMQAVMAATRAGMDGNQVYQSLSQLQNSHFQAQFLRNVGAAQTALANHDNAGFEKAMKAAYYYLPNGQELQMHKATAADVKAAGPNPGFEVGDNVIENPFQGLPGHENAPSMVGLNASNLALVAQQALDPTMFGSTMYQMAAKTQAEMLTAQGTYYRGWGIGQSGSGAFQRSLNQRDEVAGVNAVNKAHAEYYLTQAQYQHMREQGLGGGPKVKPSDVRQASQQAYTAFQNAAQGEMVAQPSMIPNPDPNTVKSQPMIVNPHAGQPYRDPKQVAPLFADLSPADREEGAKKAAEIGAANVGMSSAQAAQYAARIVHYEKDEAAGKVQQHIDPQTKKPAKDVAYWNEKGADGKLYPSVGIWDPASQSYRHMWLTPNVDQSGSDQPSSGIEGGPAAAGGADEQDHTAQLDATPDQ